MSARNAGAGAAAPALHDPAWTARVFWTLAAAALLMPALWATEFRPWIMFEPESLRATWTFAAGFFRPGSIRNSSR